jgi:hypothetical protein
VPLVVSGLSANIRASTPRTARDAPATRSQAVAGTRYDSPQSATSFLLVRSGARFS